MIRIPLHCVLWLAVSACSENAVHSLDTGESAESIRQETNRAPSEPVVRISPASPSSDDDLRCQRAQPSVDPEGDPVTYVIRWEVV